MGRNRKWGGSVFEPCTKMAQYRQVSIQINIILFTKINLVISNFVFALSGFEIFLPNGLPPHPDRAGFFSLFIPGYFGKGNLSIGAA